VAGAGAAADGSGEPPVRLGGEDSAEAAATSTVLQHAEHGATEGGGAATAGAQPAGDERARMPTVPQRTMRSARRVAVVAEEDLAEAAAAGDGPTTYDEEYEVDAILAERRVPGGRKFKVAWVGYGNSTTWEPEANVADTRALEQYYERKKTKRKTKRAPTTYDEEYEVDSILAERRVPGGRKFKVKWVGYGNWTTWEPEAHVADTRALEQYYERKKGKARRAKSSTTGS